MVPIRAPELHGCALESSFREGVKREKLRSLAQVRCVCHDSMCSAQHVCICTICLHGTHSGLQS